MAGWHHRLNGHEFEQTLGESEGQGNLARCSPWGGKELDMTVQLNNNNKKNSDNTKSWREYGQAGSLMHCCWRGKMAQPFWKRFIVISLKPKLATAIPPNNCTAGLYREIRLKFTKSVVQSCPILGPHGP